MRGQGGRSRLRLGRQCLPALAILMLTLHVLLACRLSSKPAAAVLDDYSLTPLFPSFGAEVTGLQLQGSVSPTTQQRFREDLIRHRLLLLRGQGVISGERQVEIGTWFGQVKVEVQHPRAPCRGISRMSNDGDEGITGVGKIAWWHNDGAYVVNPSYYASYHIINATEGGNTLFTPLSDVVARLSPEQRRRWERLYTSTGKGNPINCLICSHPTTNKPTLLFSTGFIKEFYWDAFTPAQRLAGEEEKEEILAEFRRVFAEKAVDVYNHTWRPGDIIFADNRDVAHLSPPEAHLPREQVGLRVLHRVLVRGHEKPRKHYRVDLEGNIVSQDA